MDGIAHGLLLSMDLVDERQNATPLEILPMGAITLYHVFPKTFSRPFLSFLPDFFAVCLSASAALLPVVAVLDLIADD